MACKIYRDKDGRVQNVIAPNGQISRLYADILKMPQVDKDEELAVDLYLAAYTPSFKSYFGDFELGEARGLVDENNEPFASSILRFLTNNEDENTEDSLSAEVDNVDTEEQMDGEDLASPLLQMSSKEIEEANQELDKYLLDFLKQFGVKSKEFDNLKERLGIDALGATDVLNKLIWYKKDRRIDTIPEEAGHMIVMLMGMDHPEIKALLTEITGWTEYKNIYNQYMPIYKNEQQVKIEAVGKLLAQSLVKNYKEYGTNVSLIRRALKIISEFFERIAKIMTLGDALVYTDKLADKITLNVLAGNKDYIATVSNQKLQLDYQKALEKNPLAQSIINTFTNTRFKFKLTGSLAIAGQGEKINRPTNEPIHDLDFTVDGIEDVNDLINFMEDEMGYTPVHSGWDHKDYKTYAYFITPPGYRLEVTRRQGAIGWAKELRLFNESGVQVPVTRENVVAVDFFVRYDNRSEGVTGIFKKWQDVFRGKLSLGGPNARMFSREKDQQDYIESDPLSRDRFLPEFVYFQLDDETRSFKKRLREKANDLQKKIIDDIYFEPKPGEDDPGRVVLEEENHIYIHTVTGQTFKSTTTAIKGELDDPEGLYELNRLFGKKFDVTLQNIIEGKSFDESKKNMPGIISEEHSRRAYDALQGIIIGLTADGSIVLPQVIFHDVDSLIAGSLDLFVVKPDGRTMIIDLKVSKTSWQSDKYRNTSYPVNKGSVLEGPLTTQQQHGIQVGVYKRLAEINGYPVDSTMTVHIKLDVEGVGKNQKVNEFVWEGIQEHLPSENESFVSQIVKRKPAKNKVASYKKSLGLHNPANDDKFLTEEEEIPEDDIPGDILDKLKYTIKFYTNKLRQREQYLKTLSKLPRFEMMTEQSFEQAVDRISQLLTSIETLDAGRPDISFGRLLNYTKDRLTSMYKYITDPEKVGKEGYIDVVLEAEKFVESYRGIASIPEIGLGSSEQHKLMREVQSMLNAVKDEINPALEAYVKDLLMKKSNQQMTPEELEQIVKEGFDIDLAGYAVSDMQNSKERLLAVAANMYTEASQKALNKSEQVVAKIKTMGNKLAKALNTNKINFSFMLNYDKEGKFTGRYLQAIGQQYYELRKKMFALLKDEAGNKLEYIEIKNLKDADAASILHNIEVQRRKEQVRMFREAEMLNEKNQIVGGEYHRYSQEFIQQRALFERPNAAALRKGILEWERKPEVTKEAHRRFRDKYYDRVEYVGAKFEKDGTYKGKTEKRIGYFPKSRYIEIREITAKGEDMRDPRYVKLMNPTTEAERAMKEFYEFFNENMRAQLEKLPVHVQQKMLGKVARVKENYLNAAKRNGTGMFKAIAKGVQSWFDFSGKLHSVQRLTDDDGVPVDNLPILYTSDPRNEKAIESIQKKIKDLKDQYMIAKSISREEYEKSLKKLELSLAIENAKIDLSDINVDLVENLISFTMMAEKYEQMADIESSLLAISKVLEKKKYYDSNSLEEKLVKKGTDGETIYKKEGTSLAYQRMKKWFKMVYYNNDEYDYSTIAQVANRLQNITSLKGIGFNIFGAVNNYVMGRINNAIEAYGGVYYDRQAYFRAQKEYNVEYMPGLLRGMGSKDGVYHINKPNSKYEALVNYFRIVRKYQEDSGKMDAFQLAYMFQEGGEYNVQSKTGIAVTMSSKFELTHETTGEKVSVFDAFNFNPDTGELSLKPGYSLPEELRTRITTYIYEVNKQIHGNYAWEDRMVIQSHWLGQLGAQFHKWVVPLFKARFQERYLNENLGYIEGRYRTFWNVIKYVYETEQGFLGKTAGILGVFIPGSKTYKQMDEIQVRNMYKNIAELSFFMASVLMAQLFSMLAQGVDDDDEQLKRLLNFMIYQQTRQQNEIKTFIPLLGVKEQYQMAKNPIAALTTLRDYGEMMSSFATMPFPPYEENYYERGPYKGSLKAWKEAKDVIPALGILNRWESFDNVKSFYIR